MLGSARMPLNSGVRLQMTVIRTLLEAALFVVSPALSVSANRAREQAWGFLDDSCIQLDASSTVLKQKHPHAFGPHSSRARYPEKAAQDGVSGKVSLRIQVNPTGQVTAVRVLHADPPGYFEQSAIEAAQSFAYEPHIIDGTAVCFKVDRDVEFKIVANAT